MIPLKLRFILGKCTTLFRGQSDRTTIFRGAYL